ncbi:MAG: LacI family DNA-binding transcriptional regulator, partial [Phycisphaeraceae bacterium]|nr:LacI family DNA-binding transcriptional regulator [Phycisphaeraceae bacterium]
MVTLKQISDESGFSIRTVSVALNGDPVSGRISETCVQKIKKIARERGYKVSAAARAIRLKRTSQVGVLVRNDAENPRVDPASYETILGINQQMEPMDYIVSMIRYTDVADQFVSQSRVFKEQVLDGIITIGNIPLNCCSTIFKAIKTCVWVDNNASNLQHTVSRDEHHAGWLAAHHVCQLGYRQVYWLGPTPDALGMHISVLQRYEGVMSCLNEQGITPRVRLLPYW